MIWKWILIMCNVDSSYCEKLNKWLLTDEGKKKFKESLCKSDFFISSSLIKNFVKDNSLQDSNYVR